ncbi:MAG: sugar transferase [Anaerolineae bacterium]
MTRIKTHGGLEVYQMIIKRIFDIALSFTTLVLLSPLFLLIALLIKFDSKGPIFFVQERIGKDGRPFRLIKFRTMIVGAQNVGLGLELARNDERVTRVGRFLRHWSLDELPQFINVLKGEMSIIGPRPSLASQVARYTPRQRRRLEVKPGMAGWAWINGRNLIPWTERIELDIWYVDHWSLWLDFIIFLKAIAVAIRREGLYGPDGIVHDLE